MKRNVLWIMCDQLRFDYLSCYGHPHLHTPNIDALAKRGVRFTRAYVQSPVCGPSRMSYYTGRYMRSHGANWNQYPLRVGEPTLGDHLKEIGVRNVLLGKTHMKADLEGMMRLGIDPESDIGVHIAQCGFEPYERDDGLHPNGRYDANPRYDDYLREHGFDAANPWQDWANSGEDEQGKLLNGWLLEHADKAARVEEKHAETPYLTQRAMQFMDEAQADGRPWCLHLSYIKPHWPYIVPAPYHDMYGQEHILPANRAISEKENTHPVYQAFMQHQASKSFAKDEVREHVIPAYMGLIKQIDDQMGVLFKYMEEQGLMDNTMIVFTADHGDYMGDHWLGEKDLFHEPSVKVPLIIYDPSSQADAARGSVCDELVEGIDLAPTFMQFLGGETKPHILEGQSLLPWLQGTPPKTWREYAFSEYDYAMQPAREILDQATDQCRLFMVTNKHWKYMKAVGHRSMLFDLENDPNELQDLGADPAYASVCLQMEQALSDWALKDHNRITLSNEKIEAQLDRALAAGILIGYWDETEVEAERQRIEQK